MTTSTTSTSDNSSRIAELLVRILVRAAQQNGQISAARQEVMLCFFQGNMRYSPAQLLRVQRQMEATQERSLDLFNLVAEFRARLDGNPRLERIAYNSCLLLTEMIYRLIHADARPSNGELSRARAVAGQLGIFSDDLRRVELRYGIAVGGQAQQRRLAQVTGPAGARPAPPRPGAVRQAGLERFEWLYISILVQMGCLDGHFTRGKLRLILEFFQGNMLYSGERLHHVGLLAQQAWNSRNQPENALTTLAAEFHRCFNYATRRMLLDHAFRLIWTNGHPQKVELCAARELANRLRIFSADLKGIEHKYWLKNSARQLEQKEQRQARAEAEQRDRQARQEHPGAQARQEQERARRAEEQRRQKLHPPKTTPVGEAEYCAILGVRPGDSLAVIKKAWRAQALKFHPDKLAHLGADFVALAEQKTKAINAAYSYFAERRKAAP